MESFGQLFTRHGGDRDTDHCYGRIYDRLFPAGRRPLVKDVLDIGQPAGWRALAGAFPQALIEGWNANPVSIGEDRIITRVVDATSPPASDQTYDLIVDDGSHVLADQAATLRCLWDRLKPDGVYVIEDIQPHTNASEIIRRAGISEDPDCHHLELDLRHVRGHFDDRLLLLARVPVAERLGPIRVLFASHELTLSGAPILLATLIERLGGIAPTVYSPSDGPLKNRLLRAGIPVTHDLDLRNTDVIVANTIVSCPAVEAAIRAGIPLVWMIHESDPSLFPQHGWAAGLLPHAFRTVFPCHSSAASYAPYCQASSEVISLRVPPPPCPDRASERVRARSRLGIGEEFVILTVGSIEPRKGQSDLVRIAADLPAKIFVVGRVLDHGEVAGAPGNVVIVSETDSPGDYYAAADLYVCCSRIEAFPLTVMEAASHGLPVVATPVYGVRDQVHEDHHGVYYPPGDTEELKKKIRRIIADPAWRASVSRPMDHLPDYAESLRRLGAIIAEAAGHGLPPRPVTGRPRVVWHVAGMGNWREGVTEQLRSLKRSGLTSVTATHVGEAPRWLLDEAARHGIDLLLCQHEDDLGHHETLAMRLVERIAAMTDDPILYFHTKGVSEPGSLNKAMWRRLMQRQVVERWRENIAALAGHDVVGVNWWNGDENHFSGNFWMARAGWIRGLPDFARYHAQNSWGRYACERWIGSVPGARALSLVCHDRKFWVDGVPQG
ncbi:glycosyltransferase [Zavarzinella formosa]|uniref:glycosyltransferase n=1 Tax=Zavarzinella formosa TaxID=360055 RepID=UPI0002D2A184|nr:glycosyltransferase [Zavarzinella formosa]